MNSLSLFKSKISLFFLLIILLPILSSAQTEWQVLLHISCNAWQTTLHFGVHKDGSDDFDSGLDALSPPPGFGPLAYFYIESFPNYLLTDIREPDESIIWQLYTDNCSGKTLKLKWDIAQFNAETDENVTLEMSSYCSMTNVDSFMTVGDISVRIKFSIPSSTLIDADSLDNNKVRKIMAFPNPFNRIVSIVIPKSGPIFTNISIYDVLGRLVNTIFRGDLSDLNHMIYWDGMDKTGNEVATGLYVCRAVSGNQVFGLKIQLLR
jgi:hypothetical protein